MDLLEINKIFLLIIFALPGFLALNTYSIFTKSKPNNFNELLLSSISYSCFIYALFLIPIYLVESFNLSASFFVGYLLFYIFVVLIFPAFVGYVWFIFRKSKIAMNYMPHPIAKPWDYVFSQRKCHWVIVNLKDGRKIGGIYGEKSFTSDTPNDEQIYLEEQWLLSKKGNFKKKINETEGVMILSSEISNLELYKVKPE